MPYIPANHHIRKYPIVQITNIGGCAHVWVCHSHPDIEEEKILILNRKVNVIGATFMLWFNVNVMNGDAFITGASGKIVINFHINDVIRERPVVPADFKRHKSRNNGWGGDFRKRMRTK